MNADWAVDPQLDGVVLSDSLVSWRRNKQLTLSKSSTEAEYRAMSSVLAKLYHFDFQGLLSEFGIPYSNPTPLYA